MTEQTQRALEGLPGEFGPDNHAQAVAERELKARSRQLLETLDELCDELVGAGLCVAETNALHRAQDLLRETTRAMLGEK